MTINELYRESLKQLKNPDVDEINIRILICYIKGYKSMSDFYIHKDESIEELQTFHSYFARFLSGEPIQYITNFTEFYNEKIYVDRRVLIPRQETEEVVDYAIRKTKEIFGEEAIDIADVCCGSGCMGLCAYKKLNCKKIYLSDISFDALEVARFNFEKNNINAAYFQGDSLESLINNRIKVNLLLSNPPYIINKNDVDESAENYEPHLALYTNDELYVYAEIFKKINKLKKGKLLAVFEIGYDIKDQLEALIKKDIHRCEYEFVKDINGKYRILSIYLK